jgi:hypothetical protein
VDIDEVGGAGVKRRAKNVMMGKNVLFYGFGF